MERENIVSVILLNSVGMSLLDITMSEQKVDPLTLRLVLVIAPKRLNDLELNFLFGYTLCSARCSGYLSLR